MNERSLEGPRVRVVHVVVAGDIGGAERLLVDLASRPDVSAADHTIALMTPNRRLAEWFKAAGLRVCEREGVRENPVAYLKQSLGLRDVSWLEEVMRKERADVAQLHTFGSHVIGVRAALRVKAKVLRTEHHVDHFRDPSTALFTRWSLARADAVVAVSDYVAAFIARAVPRVAPILTTIRNGVDVTYFSPRATPAPPNRGTSAFKFVTTCRLERWKRVDLALRALAEVPGVLLDVVGDGAERARLSTLARSLGVADRVQFHGYQKDPRAIVAAADAALSSSRDEPLGLSVLEALSLGKPVVAFAGGGIPEIVRDGVTGWLAEPGSLSSLIGCMMQAASDVDRARRMGEEARRFVLSSASIETMCAAYAEVYKKLRDHRVPAPSDGVDR